jgi:hypothetical protein
LWLQRVAEHCWPLLPLLPPPPPLSCSLSWARWNFHFDRETNQVFFEPSWVFIARMRFKTLKKESVAKARPPFKNFLGVPPPFFGHPPDPPPPADTAFAAFPFLKC